MQTLWEMPDAWCRALRGRPFARLRKITKKGIPPVIMADGPAGLRLQPHFKAMPDGTLIPGGKIRGNDREPFPEKCSKRSH